MSPLGVFVDVIRDFLRPVEIDKGLPARLARRLNGKIAHAENSLADPLIYRYVLYLRNQDGARGPPENAPFVSQHVIEDR
jgi:hypothetical protein